MRRAVVIAFGGALLVAAIAAALTREPEKVVEQPVSEERLRAVAESLATEPAPPPHNYDKLIQHLASESEKQQRAAARSASVDRLLRDKEAEDLRRSVERIEEKIP
jgi:hypothetical protein